MFHNEVISIKYVNNNIGTCYFPGGTSLPSVESLVAYLLELPQQGMEDTVFEIKPHSSKIEKKQTPYRWRSCFASEDEYAQYLSDVITPGMTVRCCKAYECVSIIINIL